MNETLLRNELEMKENLMINEWDFIKKWISDWEFNKKWMRLYLEMNQKWMRI